jgi:hypothetical protein
LADRGAKTADVRAIEGIIVRIRQRDAELGERRPDVVNGLLAAVGEKLDAARRLQLARDRWAQRAPVLGAYQVAMATPLDLFTRLSPLLQDIKLLAGSSPAALDAIDRLVTRVVTTASVVAPPEEFQPVHALFVSAAQLAQNAAKIRREATMANDMARAWDASSAAAGSLMLITRARGDMQALLRPPQPR